MAVLEDIAKKSGVSISTASRALKNDGRISQVTKEKVLSAADALGYDKHLNKRDSNHQSPSAGIIVPEVVSGYYAQLVHLANDAFARHQLSSIINITNFKKEEMVRHIKNFAKIGVRCLLIMADDSEEISDDIFNAVSSVKAPVLFITSNYLSNLDFDSLYIDEKRGIAMALEHLIERGYQRIGFIGEKQSLGRHKVYRDLMRKYGMPIDERFVKISTQRAEDGGYSCMKEMLQESDHPDAVFSSYDQMAIGGIFAIEEAGLEIPADIAVIGFDDMHVSRFIHKGISTIKNPYEDMISIAVRVLLKRIEHPESAPQQIALKPSIVIRGTT